LLIIVVVLAAAVGWKFTSNLRSAPDVVLTPTEMAEAFRESVELAVTRHSESHLKRLVNHLHLPLEHRQPGIPPITSSAELEKWLTANGLSLIRPEVRHFVDLYNEAPRDSATGRRGYY